MRPLTERQDKILGFIRQSIRERGYPPTLREIGAQMGIRSTNGVSDHLRALERKGYLKREDMKSRALVPVDNSPVVVADDHSEMDAVRDGNGTIEVPLLGRVAAGPLSLATEADQQTFALDPELVGGESRSPSFALRVKGDSMIDAGIYEGDLLFVKSQNTASKGEIVVARLGEEATVKRFFPEKDAIRLQPENKRLAPIMISKRDAAQEGFEILGVVVGLFRAVRG